MPTIDIAATVTVAAPRLTSLCLLDTDSPLPSQQPGILGLTYL
jgi:hypothetical protein